MYNIPFDAPYEVKCGWTKDSIEKRGILPTLKLFPRISQNKEKIPHISTYSSNQPR